MQQREAIGEVKWSSDEAQLASFSYSCCLLAAIRPKVRFHKSTHDVLLLCFSIRFSLRCLLLFYFKFQFHLPYIFLSDFRLFSRLASNSIDSCLDSFLYFLLWDFLYASLASLLPFVHISSLPF